MEAVDFRMSKTINTRTIKEANIRKYSYYLNFEPVLGSKPVDSLSLISM